MTLWMRRRRIIWGIACKSCTWNHLSSCSFVLPVYGVVCVFCKLFLFTVLTWMIAGRILIRRAWKKIGTALMKTIVLFFIYGMFQFLVAFQVELLLCWRVQSQIFWSFRRRQRFRRTWCSCSFLIFKLILCTYLAALQCPSYDCQHQPTPGDKHG